MSGRGLMLAFVGGAGLALAATSGAPGGLVTPALATERTVTAPPAAYDPPARGQKVAILAGGCFWGVEGVFEHVRGVASVTSGYAGGRGPANYGAVSTGTTGNAEAVRIAYDPAVVSYGTLLRIFFSVVHDPTQKDRQGPDEGTQYRGAIFPSDAAQRAVAARYIAQLTKARLFPAPIVTRIEPTANFRPAEAYHQDFMKRNPNHGYIRAWDVPKVEALKARFPGAWKA